MSTTRPEVLNQTKPNPQGGKILIKYAATTLLPAMKASHFPRFRLTERLINSPIPYPKPAARRKLKYAIGPIAHQAAPHAKAIPAAVRIARMEYLIFILNVGSLFTLAHSGQRAPTGVCTIQRGHIGLPHLPQRRFVSTSGCAAHFNPVLQSPL